MSKRRRPQKAGRSVDIGRRTLEEYGEVERRAYHQKIRAELIQRGAIVQAVERLLEDAAPRFKDRDGRSPQEAGRMVDSRDRNAT